MLMFAREGSSCNNNRRLTGDMQQAKSRDVAGLITLYFLVRYEQYYQRFVNSKFSLHAYWPRKLKTLEADAWPPPIARKPRTDARFIANALLFSVVGNAFRLVSGDGTCKWNRVCKFSTSWTFPWQKRQVTDSLIFSCSLSPATIAWPWSCCHVSVFSLSRSSRGFSTVFFDCLVLNVDVETDGSHSALSGSFNSFSHCSWLKEELFITLR